MKTPNNRREFLLNELSRRRFMKLAGAGTFASFLAACAPQVTPEVKEIIKEVTKEVPVTKEVIKEIVKEVEKVVTATPEPEALKTLRYAFAAEMSGWDPDLTANSESSRAAILAQTNGLLESAVITDEAGIPMKDGTNLVPSLAKEWEVSDDGTALTLTLREGVTFSDGAPFTAEDVAYTVERLLDPDSGGTIGGFLIGLGNFTLDPPLEIVDDYTITLHLDPKINSMTLLMIGDMMYTNIVNKELFEANATADDPYAREWAKKEAWKGLGTGAYALESWDPTNAVLKARGDYWGGPHGTGPARIDTVEAVSIPDPTQRALLLREGAIDATEMLNLDELLSFAKDPRFTVWAHPGPEGIHLCFNVNWGPFQDVRVRQAICHMFDRDLIAQQVAGGFGDAFWGAVPPSVPGSTESFKSRYPYDPDKARALLKEAGYEDGFEFELVHDEGWANEIPIANIIASELSKYGINVSITRVPSATLYGLGEVEACLWHFTTLVFDAGYYMNFNYGTGSWGTINNYSNWGDEDSDAQLTDIMNETDKGKRDQMMVDLQERIADEAPRCPMIWVDEVFVSRSNVQNVFGWSGNWPKLSEWYMT